MPTSTLIIRATFVMCGCIGSTHARELFYFISHGDNNSTTSIDGAMSFWRIPNKGATDAAAGLDATLEIRANGLDRQANKMSEYILEAVAMNASAIVTTLIDRALPAIRTAIAAGIPVYGFNSGFDTVSKYPVLRGRAQYMTPDATCADVKNAYASAKCCQDETRSFDLSKTALVYHEPAPELDGVTTYVGQDELFAGMVAGERAAADGVTSALCLVHEPFSRHIVERCEGYSSVVANTTTLDISPYYQPTLSMFESWPGDPVNDPLLNFTIGLLAAHPGRAVQVVTPVQCLYFATALTAHALGIWTYVPLESIEQVYLSCFDTFPDPNWFNNVKSGRVKFTINQGPYLQGFHAVTAAILNTRYNIKHYGNILTGPDIIDASNVNAYEAAALAGYA